MCQASPSAKRYISYNDESDIDLSQETKTCTLLRHKEIQTIRTMKKSEDGALIEAQEKESF